MRKNKKHWVLLFGLIILLLSFAVGCGQPGYTTYNNETGGYSISYPLNWQVEVSEDGTRCLITSPTRRGSIMIDVEVPMTAKDAATRWTMSLGTHWSEITLLENKPMEGLWNWYLSYDYEADTGPFHGEAYFKSTADHIYKLDTAGDADGYKNYPFSTIISSFKLK